MEPGTQQTNLANVARFILSRPRQSLVLLRKLRKRLDGSGKYSPEENARWIEQLQQLSSEYARARDPELWSEALDFGQALRDRAKRILAGVPFDMGAGGDYQFLYWLTRRLKPHTIVETGVSAGWSSQAFLAALEANGSGRLYSSDFPFFRVRNPERYIGILVEDRRRWELHTDGDENALPRILDTVKSVDLFHYDSDKSLSGRNFACTLVRSKLSGPMLVDDILNNSWFREFVEAQRLPFEILTNETQHCYGMITAR